MKQREEMLSTPHRSGSVAREGTIWGNSSRGIGWGKGLSEPAAAGLGLLLLPVSLRHRLQDGPC